MTAFPSLTPVFIDEQMFYRDFCILTQHIDDLRQDQAKRTREARRVQ